MKNFESKVFAAVLLAALLGGAGYLASVAKPSQADAPPLSEDSVSPMDKFIQRERDAAVTEGRNGQYDDALDHLAKLHERYPDVEPITRDYMAVLSWAGHNEEAVAQYEALPAEQPDYVLSAAGHSYRVLKQPEKAMAAYQLGEQKYPDSAIMVEGEIRTLMDQGKLDEAGARADQDLHDHGDRPEITAAKADIEKLVIQTVRDKAVELARDRHYAEALALFKGPQLDAEHTTDVGIRQDYLSVLSWAGKHDKEVIEIYTSLNDVNQPDYVTSAVAKSYRNLHKGKEALAMYRDGMSKFPDNISYAQGEIGTLLDMKRTGEAAKAISVYEKAHGADGFARNARHEIERIKFFAVRDKAAKLARQGKFDEAMAILQKLGSEHANDLGIKRDRLVITGWMEGHDQDVIDQFNALNNPDQPEYVLEAVAKAYRNLGQNEEAATMYQNTLKRHPSSEALAVGYIRTSADAGYIEKSLSYANENLRKYGNRLNVLLAAADAANQYDLPDSVRYYQTAAKIAPNNPEVQRALMNTADRMGAPGVAAETMKEHPGLMSAGERRRIEGDEAAAMVRLGMLEQEEKKSYATTDAAIERLQGLIAKWQQEGPDAQQNILRARYDLIIALHNRSRMQDVVNEYGSLQTENAQPPVFTLGAVGDAYMDMHQPEQARDIYIKLLQIEPNNGLAERQLFYAYVDLGEWRNAYRTADKMVADGTMWDVNKNSAVPMTNPQMRDAELTAGAARLYFGEVSEADKRILPVAAKYPDAPSIEEALGNLADAHDHPREALTHYQAGEQLSGGDISDEVGITNTELQLHDFADADRDMKSLMSRYPENLSVQRAQRDSDVYNMAEFDLNAGYYFQPMTSHNVNGGQGFGVDAKIYSSPYKYNWRLFAGEYFAHQKEPNSEGSVDFSRSTAGVEYRDQYWTANLAPTFNTFNSTERVGAAADVSYAFNDSWTVAGSGELFSRNTPLRALNQGVTSDMGTVHAVWQQDETRSVRFGGSVQPFSDSNFRTEEDIDLTQRIWTYPYWKVDALASLSADQNSKDENRSYYNPSSDFIGLIGARAIQTLYQRYSTLWQHTLQVMPGIYEQAHYGADPTVRARYEHRVFFNQTFEAGLGLNFQRQDYDGQAENDISVTLDLVDHF